METRSLSLIPECPDFYPLGRWAPRRASATSAASAGRRNCRASRHASSCAQLSCSLLAATRRHVLLTGPAASECQTPAARSSYQALRSPAHSRGLRCRLHMSVFQGFKFFHQVSPQQTTVWGPGRTVLWSSPSAKKQRANIPRRGQATHPGHLSVTLAKPG